MRPKIHLMSYVLVPCLALMVDGCLEIETTSTVRTDGTILRTVVVKGDSSAVHEGRFPLPVDSTWERQIERADSRKFVLTATRVFRDAAEMNEALKGSLGKTMGVHVDLQKSFQWFFTTYRYRETLLNFNPFRAIPITDYISPSELDFFMRHEFKKEPYPTKGDSLALKDAGERFDTWLARNQFEEYYRTFIDGVEKLGDRTLTPAAVAAAKEILFEKSRGYFESNNIDTLKLIFEGVLKSRSARKVYVMQSEGFEVYEANLRFLNDLMTNSYVTNVEVPGLIVETNAPALDGTRASWKDYIKFCLFADIDLTVESRVTNWWAITVTGFVVSAILVLFVATIIRRRRTI